MSSCKSRPRPDNVFVLRLIWYRVASYSPDASEASYEVKELVEFQLESQIGVDESYHGRYDANVKRCE